MLNVESPTTFCGGLPFNLQNMIHTAEPFTSLFLPDLASLRGLLPQQESMTWSH
jgi:hypothetical protein